MSIARCESVGKFRVVFIELGKDDEGNLIPFGHMKLTMPQHGFDAEVRDGSPILDTEDPFEGELCDHELRWLKGYPGYEYNYHWRFEITPLGAKKQKKK